MKSKLLLATFFFISFLDGFAQEYHPFLNNSSWHVHASDFNTVQNFIISPGEEVQIGAYSYSKIFDTVNNVDVFVREDLAAKKIYRLINGNETILYDFSLSIGDTTMLANGLVYTVDVEGITNVNGGQRRRLYLEHQIGTLTYFETWIEGVGSPVQPLKPSYELFTDPDYSLRCSAQNGQMIYNWGISWNGTATSCDLPLITESFKHRQNFSFAPNPFRTQLYIESSQNLENAIIKIYNSLGQLVQEVNNLSGIKIILERKNLSAGIYLTQISENENVVASKKILVVD